MRRVLAERDVRLTRSLGQNFLHDGNQLRRIVAAADLSKHDIVIEIGPGLGPLTELLLDSAGAVVAIEKDHKLADYLRERFADAPGLNLVEADVLDYLGQCRLDLSVSKLVANLPYSAASAILLDLASRAAGPQCMIVTLQMEVAQKLMAAPGSPGYGTLTLLVQASYEPGDWFRIAASCFYPEPQVDSACLRLDRRSPCLLGPNVMPCFAGLVRLAFSQRRKMLFKVLKGRWKAPELESAFGIAGLDLRVRPEDVSLHQFAGLARALAR